MRTFFHKTFRRISVVMTLIAVLALFSCDAENTYSSHQCYFVFNTQLHPVSLLVSAVTPPGDGFVLVHKELDGSTEKVYVEKYGEKDTGSPYVYTTAGLEPTVKSLVIGYDNGLLIGYSAIENKVLAFDRRCKKCENNARAKVQWYGSNTIVKCPVCGSIYNLNISGNGLDWYKNASYDGMYVRVIN